MHEGFVVVFLSLEFLEKLLLPGKMICVNSCKNQVIYVDLKLKVQPCAAESLLDEQEVSWLTK